MPKATSRSAITVAVPKSRATDQAMLWASVEAPTPPLAPTTATVRPRGSAVGLLNRSEIAAITATGSIGAIRYSLTPRRTNSRYSTTSLTWPINHHLGAGVADLRQAVEGGERMGSPGADLHHDDVRGRGVAERLDGGGGAAHLDAGMRLLHPPVAGRRLDHPGDLGLSQKACTVMRGTGGMTLPVESPVSDMVNPRPEDGCPSAPVRLVAEAALVRRVVISLSHLALYARATILLPSG